MKKRNICIILIGAILFFSKGNGVPIHGQGDNLKPSSQVVRRFCLLYLNHKDKEAMSFYDEVLSNSRDPSIHLMYYTLMKRTDTNGIVSFLEKHGGNDHKIYSRSNYEIGLHLYNRGEGPNALDFFLKCIQGDSCFLPPYYYAAIILGKDKGGEFYLSKFLAMAVPTEVESRKINERFADVKVKENDYDKK